MCQDGICVNAPIPKCMPVCVEDSDCDDGYVCTDDRCIDGACHNDPIDGCVEPCLIDEDCDDDNACTVDACVDGVCEYTTIPDCVPCDSELLCPPMDLVLVMDTSGSMGDEANVLCSKIDDVVADLRDVDVQVTPHVLGITETPGFAFWCLTDDVVNLLGGTVPGDPGACPFPDGSFPMESWGPATAIVADRFPWSEGSLRIIVPMSDEGPCDGSFPEGCNDPGDDRDAIDNAIAVAGANGVVVSPVTASGSDLCVKTLAADLAAGTGGTVFQSIDPHNDLANGLYDILLSACEMIYQCDDGDACTDDECVDDVCVFTLNYDDDTYCCDPVDGELTPIDDNNVCTLDACDPQTGDTIHTPVEDGTFCDDGSVCTDDACVDGACVGTPNYDDTLYCCDPVDGVLTELADDDPCTDDVCDPETGEVSHPPADAGTLCDDGDKCTVMDECDEYGGCHGTEIDTIACDSNDDCYGYECNLQTGLCECVEIPTLCLVPIPSEADVAEGCYIAGEELVVNIELGYGSAYIAGGQFAIPYDPTLLDFVSIAPGSEYDPESPFALEIYKDIDEDTGFIFYSVGVQFVTTVTGTRGPATMATVRFIPLVVCSETELCLVSENPFNTLLTDDEGHSAPYELDCCTGPMRFDDGAPTVMCPESTQVDARPGQLSAVVTWDPVEALDGCDDEPVLDCTAAHSGGVNIDHLIETGGVFPAGRSEFACTATDSCEQSVSCNWYVEVSGMNRLVADVHLSPTMAEGPLRRCINFEFFSSCIEEPIIAERVLEFGLPYNLPGHARTVAFNIPAGQYFCVAARDPLHTLRSTAVIEIVGDRYEATFEGDPFFDGNWLIGGNVDGNRVIDVLDFAVYAEQELTYVDADTPCDAIGPHADINGDGIVDQLDWSFIQANLERTDVDACCPGSREALEPPVPLMEVSVKDLERMGLGHLSVADLNFDGRIDMGDIDAYNAGVRPARARTVRPHTPSTFKTR